MGHSLIDDQSTGNIVRGNINAIGQMANPRQENFNHLAISIVNTIVLKIVIRNVPILY